MNTLIVATDFSASAENAVLYAAKMAAATNANLHIVHICSISLAYTELGAAFETEEWCNLANRRIEEVRINIQERTRNVIKVTTEVRIGVFLAELNEICCTIRPFCVVMGAVGKNAAERFFFGSNTIEAARRLIWPLVIVPAQYNYQSIQKIALACDLRDDYKQLPVADIERMVTSFEAHLSIVHVVEDDVYNADARNGARNIEKLLEKCSPEFHFMGKGNVNSNILQFAGENKIDLLILFPKEYNMLVDLFHRSHTKQVILHSQLPIMILHNNV